MEQTFTNEDVAEYYNTTQIHYEKWWRLRENLSLHYGIWEPDTKTFGDALENTNKIIMDTANIVDSEKILDAGCGVGGAAVYMCSRKNVEVVGITLSHKQLNFANRIVKQKKLDEKISFHIMDYCKTSFPDESFDVVWACESMTTASNKYDFIKEAHRVLKVGGRLVVCDYFLTEDNPTDKNGWLQKWVHTWSSPHIVSLEYFSKSLHEIGFTLSVNDDYTAKIYKTAQRMYRAVFFWCCFF